MGAGHVFVSYSSTDRPFADELVQALQSAGLRIWYAPRDVRPGIDYSEQIQKAIETATAFVVIVTESSNRSNFVRAETEMAFSRRRPIFPVRTSPVVPASGLALFLQLRHWTDMFGPGRQSALQRLCDELAAGKPAGSRRGGPTLFRPRFLRGTVGSDRPASRLRAPVILIVVGAGALILAAILAIPAAKLANLEASEMATTGDPGNAAGNLASVPPGAPNYDPLVENWMRDARENAPPPPEVIDNVVDPGTDPNMSMTTPDETVEVNGM